MAVTPSGSGITIDYSKYLKAQQFWGQMPDVALLFEVICSRMKTICFCTFVIVTKTLSLQPLIVGPQLYYPHPEYWAYGVSNLGAHYEYDITDLVDIRI